MTSRGEEVALGHAARGRSVFPVRAGAKTPAIPSAHRAGDPLRGKCRGECGREGHGLHDATTDPDRIRSWFRRFPNCNWGLPTGLVFDVVDIDSPDTLAELDARMPLADDPDDDPILIGPTVETPRGWHAYVAPTGRGNTVRVGGITGLDWRGVGGYVVAPGSVKADGAEWEWLCGADDPLYGIDAPIRPAPAWILGLLERPASTPTAPAVGQPDRTIRRPDVYAAAALDAAVGRIIGTGEGDRNHRLYVEACKLRDLIAAGNLDPASVAVRLVDAAVRAGLPEWEARRSVESGLTGPNRASR